MKERRVIEFLPLITIKMFGDKFCNYMFPSQLSFWYNASVYFFYVVKVKVK